MNHEKREEISGASDSKHNAVVFVCVLDDVPTRNRPSPAPQADLDATEERIRPAIVAALPPPWRGTPAEQLLLRTVGQAAVCGRQEAQLRDLRDQEHPRTDAIGT